MNIIDLLFILLFIVSIAVGFFQGMIRLSVILVGFYLSLVLASLYFTSFGRVFMRYFGAERFVAEYVAFAILLLVGFGILAAAGLYTFRYAQLPGSLQYIDRIIGLALGLVLGALFIGIFATLLWNMMIVRGGQNIELPIMQGLGAQIMRSFLIRYYSDQLLPLVYGFLDPILPNEAVIIFQVQ